MSWLFWDNLHWMVIAFLAGFALTLRLALVEVRRPAAAVEVAHSVPAESAEPGFAEPAEMGYEEPEPAEAAYVEPEPAEAAYVEPEPDEAAYVEPEPDEAAYVEPEPDSGIGGTGRHQTQNQTHEAPAELESPEVQPAQVEAPEDDVPFWEPQPRPQPQPDPDPAPEPEPDAEPEPKPDAEPDPEPNPEPEPLPPAVPEAQPVDQAPPSTWWAIKGHRASRRFFTPDAPDYARIRADWWFDSEVSARSAGFRRWDEA